MVILTGDKAIRVEPPIISSLKKCLQYSPFGHWYSGKKRIIIKTVFLLIALLSEGQVYAKYKA